MNLRFAICDLRFGSTTKTAPLFASIPNRKSSIINGFTLIELMMVVVIIGLIMAAGVPAILSITREAPLRKAVNDVLGMCSRARAQAILQEQTMTVVFHPRLREVSLSGGAAPAGSTVPGRLGRPVPDSATFDPSVTIEGLGINDFDFTESDEARVRFFPNGTSDDMTLVLSANGEYRKITLEVTTALASVKSVK